MDVDVYLNCHQRKLQILMAAAGIGECLESCKSLLLKSGSNTRYASDIDTQESSSKQCWNLLVAEEVKSISQCVSQVKNWIDQSGDFDTIPMSSTGDMQCLLLSVVYNIASIFLSKKSSGPVNTDQIERSWFIEASIAFCKIQHLNAMINVNTQIKPEEIAAILKDFDQPRTLAPTGLFLGGTKYMVIQGEPCAVIRGKKGSGGITIKKTSQALLIGIYDEPVTPGRCNIVVERLGDYCVEQGL